MEMENNNNGGVSIWPFVLLALGIVVIYLVMAITIYYSFENWEDRGVFGDSFGAVNALFSGLAFSALIYTVHLQRKELGLQRKELEMTRAELSRSATAQEASERALTQQAKALESAAKLNAVSSVIEHYSIKIRSISSASQRQEAERAQLEYLDRLEQLLQELA
jgi:hypothetical protein